MRFPLSSACLGWALIGVLLSTSPLQAADVPTAIDACSGKFGDLDDTGTTNVVDVQCVILVTLAKLTDDEAALPECLKAPLSKADLNCDDAPNITDVLLLTYAALGLELGEGMDKDSSGCPDSCEEAACACQGDAECPGESCSLECPNGLLQDANGCVQCECAPEEDLCAGLPVMGKDCDGDECLTTFGGACDPETGIIAMDYKECGGFCDGASWCDNTACPDPKCYVPSALISLMNCGAEVDLCDNGTCDPGETCFTCGKDCGVCPALTTPCCVCELEPQCCTNDPQQAVQWGPECTLAAQACDTTPPDLNCPATLVIPGDANCVGVTPSANATDNCSPQVGVQWFNHDVIGEGPHNVVYVATDAAGNQSFCQTTVTVAGCPCDDCFPAPDDLYARWPLDEPSGNTFEDIVGNNDAHASGLPLPVTGVVGGARSFDGHAGLTVPDFKFPDDYGDFSIELWHYWDKDPYTSGQLLISRPGVFWLMSFTGFGYHVHLSPSWQWYGSPFHNPEKEWTHLAVTIHQGPGPLPAVNGVKLYANGQLVKEQTAEVIFNLNHTTPNVPATHDLFIGGYTVDPQTLQGASNWQTGDIDDVSIYTRALTAGEIEAIYDAGCSGKCYDGPQWTAGDYGTSPPICDPDTLAPLINQCGTTKHVTGCAIPTEPPNLIVLDDCDENPNVNVGTPSLVTTLSKKDEPFLSAPPNLYSYSITSTDASGNVSTCIIYVQFHQAPPEITCPQPLGIDLGNACSGPVPPATASDPCDATLPTLEMVPATLTPGLKTVTYTATNQSGLTATCTTNYQVVTNADCTAECAGKVCD